MRGGVVLRLAADEQGSVLWCAALLVCGQHGLALEVFVLSVPSQEAKDCHTALAWLFLLLLSFL